MTQKKNAPAIFSDSQSAVAASILLSLWQQSNCSVAWQLRALDALSGSSPFSERKRPIHIPLNHQVHRLCKGTYAKRWVFPYRITSWHNCRKPRGPVRKNTTLEEVATPTVKRGFVMPKFLELVRLHAPSAMVTGCGGTYPQGLSHVFERVLNHHTPPYARKNANGGSLDSLEGILSMPTINRATTAAPASLVIRADDPIQLHADARNALSMAVFYLSQPQANVSGARRKAVQALAALRGLDLSLEG